MTLSFRPATHFCNLSFSQFHWRPTKSFHFFSSFYRAHMPGPISRINSISTTSIWRSMDSLQVSDYKNNTILFNNTITSRFLGDFDGNANGSSLDCLNLIVQSINKSTTSPIQNKTMPTSADSKTPPPASGSAATGPTSLNSNFKRKCST